MKDTKSFIKELESITEKIDNEINELEQENAKIEDELREKEKDFSVNTVEETKELNDRKKHYTEALYRAKEHKNSIMIKSTNKTVERAKQLIKDYKAEVNEKAKADNKKVESLIDEIHRTYDKMKQDDNKARAEINDFIKELSVYLDDTAKKEYMRFGANQPAVDMLQRTIDNYTDLSNKFTVIKGFNEHNYRIDGLFPPAKRLS